MSVNQEWRLFPEEICELVLSEKILSDECVGGPTRITSGVVMTIQCDSSLDTAVIAAARVELAMTDRVFTVGEDASLTHATKLMGEKQIRHLVVVDWNRIPIGVFSERDLFRFMAHQLASGETIDGRVSVNRLMKEYPVTVMQSDPLDHAAGILDDRKIGCLVVVDADGRLKGILTRGDVLRYFSLRNRQLHCRHG